MAVFVIDTQDKIDVILDALAGGSTLQEIADHFSVHIRHLNWALVKKRKDDPDFKKAYYDARGLADTAIEAALFKAATEPDAFGRIDAASGRWLLRNRKPHLYNRAGVSGWGTGDGTTDMGQKAVGVLMTPGMVEEEDWDKLAKLAAEQSAAAAEKEREEAATEAEENGGE